MTKRSIFIKSIFATCLSLGVVGCSSSDSASDLAEELTDETTAEETAAKNEPVEISVTIGYNSGLAVFYKASLGSKVQIKLLNPDADDEFHLHGYELSAKATAGQETIIEFTADKLGSFDLESHVTSEWILTLVVEE